MLLKTRKPVKLIDYSSLLPTNINETVLIEIIKLASYKSKNLYENFNNKYSDPYSQISLYQSFFRNVIDRHFITHSLILNGFSLSSFSLGIVSYKKNLNISFWENGLFPKSLFINKVGVNPFASSDFNSSMEPNKRVFLSLHELIKDEFTDYKLIQNALITLQVNFDSNIKLFSPFFSTIDFLDFIIENLKSTYFDSFNFKVRNHPKLKINLNEYLKKLTNLEISSAKNFNEELSWAKIVFTINSTTGFEAILNNKNLIAFGNSYYSKFLRYRILNINGIELKVFVFNPHLESDLIRKEKLLKNLNESTLFINERKSDLIKKIINIQEKPLMPYFLKKELNKLFYYKKITNFNIPKNRLSIRFLKYLGKFINKIQAIIS